jgi:Family of unknown function (DUF5996)
VIGSLGGTSEFHWLPNEVPDPVPFFEDRAKRPYAADAVTRFFNALVAVDRVLKRLRTACVGKVSPVHLFSFDLALTRLSGASRCCIPPGHSAIGTINPGADLVVTPRSCRPKCVRP